MKKKEKYLLFLILLLAAVIRIYKITNVPPGPFSDEVHPVNAVLSYSKTGRDIDGKIHVFFYDPMMYTPPIIGLSMIPFFITFGVNLFTIRLPAIIYSLLTIFIFYKLVLFLTKNSKVGLLSAFIFSVIPWHFHYSRAGWEPASFLFYFLGGIYFLLKGRFNKNYTILGCLFFALSFYSYSIAMFFAPIFTFFIFFLFFKDYFKDKRNLLIGGFLYFIIVFPFITLFLKEPLMYRRAGRIFVASGKTFTQTLSTFSKHYLQHFSPDFLFKKGDPNLRHNVQRKGELYFSMLPFILIGGYFLLKKKDKLAAFILFWLLVFPLASAFTDDGNPHATRSLIGAPLFSLLAAYGLFVVWNSNFLKKFSFAKEVFFILIFIMLVAEITQYFNEYFLHYPLDSARAWSYGQEEVFGYVKNNMLNYERVCFNHVDWYTAERFIYFYLNNKQSIQILNNPPEETCFKENSLLVLPAEEEIIGKLPVYTILGPNRRPLYRFYKF